MVFEQVNINNKHKYIVNILMPYNIHYKDYFFYLEYATVSILKK